MNFIVDAHFPKLIYNFLLEAGHEAIHTSELPQGNRTDDVDILEFANGKNTVVISKDADLSYGAHEFAFCSRCMESYVITLRLN